ncbi:MAG: transcription termination/antitermination protein NusA [Candidatus Giovannonibacteria bacterium]|nr:MAG: transcription termination/antitermination protein NusA [Candidatus Giovannonibacteria bacterium]
MLDIKNFNAALDQLAQEKGISKEKIMETIDLALAAAYKRDYGKKSQIVRAKFDPATGGTEFWQVKLVVDESMIKSEEEIAAEEEARAEALRSGKLPERELASEEMDGDVVKKVRFNEDRHIMLADAKKTKKDAALGEELVFPLESKEDYGRIAAQTAKQVILQRVREAERDSVFDEFKEKEGEVISGIVQRVEGRLVFMDLGRTIGVLPPDEQVRGERYRIGERIKVLLLRAEKMPRGPSIYLSRSHPKLVAKLFEIEVPEIASGAVEIKNVAREAGSRTKIAVASKEEGIDPVGSCVGQKGVRVTTVIAELGGEKVDIVPWSEDKERFISSSLSPAKVLEVEIDEAHKHAKISVSEDQLSLAIGKGGQNVRLAAKLTGYKIDIRSRTGETVAEATSEGEVIGEGIAAE